MTEFRSCHMVLIAVVLLSMLAVPPAQAQREYRIPAIAVDARIDADGTVHITEQRRYDFQGAYSFANYRLPRRGFSAIRDIRVSEGDTDFINANTEQPGTFLVERSARAINLRWFYDAQDESRTFTLSYVLDGAVAVGPQWSEFFWNYLGAGRERSTDSLRIDLALPEPVPAGELRAWVRGPRERIDLALGAGSFQVAANDLSTAQSVQLRALFPSAVLAAGAATVTDPGLTLPAATAQEEDQLRREAERGRRAQLGQSLTLAIAALSVLVFALLYRRYGQAPRVGAVYSSHTLALPERVEPAAMGWLLNQRQVSAAHLMATLLDLARRGYFRIEEQPPKQGFLASAKPSFTLASTEQAPADDLRPWERSLLDYMRGRLDGATVRLDKLLKQNSSKLARWFSGWKKQLRGDLMGRGWIDAGSYTGVYWNLGLQLALLLGAVAALVMAGPIALVALAVCVIVALLSGLMLRRTPEGEALYRRWRAYRKALAKSSDRTVRRDQLDRHFIYAVALGLGNKHLESLFQANADAVPAMGGWIVLSGATLHSPAALARTFTTLNASGNAAFAGAAGVPGGGGAGAAGGGASGGAG